MVLISELDLERLRNISLFICIYISSLMYRRDRDMFSQIPNLRFVSRNFSYFLLKQGRILLLRSKKLSINSFLQKRHFAATLEEKKIGEKICRFRIREINLSTLNFISLFTTTDPK